MKTVKKFVQRLNRHVFDTVATNRLVYNTCWEDSRIDRKLLQLNSSSRMVMLSSAGDNAMNYLLDGPAHIHAVDINPAQTALLELKKALFVHDDYSSLWNFFGQGACTKALTIYHHHLRDLLPPRARLFWDEHLDYFSPSAPTGSFYYCGTAGTFAYWVMKEFRRKGIYKSIRELLEAETLAGQRYHFNEIEPRMWGRLLQWIIQQDITLALLGVPKTQRAIIDNEVSGGLTAYIQQALKQVFTERTITNNYFWRVYLTGSYQPDCCPPYLREHHFSTIQKRVPNIEISTADLIDFLQQHPGRYSHFVLLDHQDWLAHYQPQRLREEWMQLLGNAQPATKILFRSAGVSRTFIPDFVYRHVHFLDKKTTFLHARDRVGTYGSTHLAVVDKPLNTP